jgi:phosphoenolpyruvate carboxykinase (GTP)
MTSTNATVNAWVSECAKYLQPSEVHWVDGSDAESAAICEQLVAAGTFLPLNSETYPGCYWSRSHPNDVARVEDRTFICTKDRDDAGPTNNWADASEMAAKLRTLMTGAMKGRTMYVVPYLMGPVGSKFSKVGFELTDSPYVVANMRIMARIGKPALAALGDSTEFVRGVHSIGNLDPEKRYICHFPATREIVSYNSNYGGNALQGKKCFALRIASTEARRGGWLAEHMLILGITTPWKTKHYFCAAFPSACGKTNFAMLIPPASYLSKGWKIETVGDDIAWLNVGEDGQLYAINPEAGFFGVAPGTSEKTNPNALASAHRNTIFTNTALDPVRREPWWEGLGPTPERLIDWLGNEWSPELGTKAAHPNSRFTAPASQCPSIDPAWTNPAGVPISGIIFGGRRPTLMPLVLEANSWRHGVYLGLTMASQTTAAAAGAVGTLRRDPMAMLPFIGYNVGDYVAHWLSFEQRAGVKLPRIFHVNWFRTDQNGRYLWPGFGENVRVLEWMVGRIEGKVEADSTVAGKVPKSIATDGLACPPEDLKTLLTVQPHDWSEEVKLQGEFLKTLGSRLPAGMFDEHSALASRLQGK